MKCLFSVLIGLLLLTGCQTTLQQRLNTADSIAKKGGFSKEIVRGGEFWITTYQKIKDFALPFVIYIEGDGLAFVENRTKVSKNPTPIDPTAFRLATLDPRPNVVYLSRPCQYTDMEKNPACTSSYWTDKRMSEDVVASMNEAINDITHNSRVLNLVGFSGGGGIVVLIAARNNNVKSIITIAGNLNHIAFNELHNTKAMVNSLNPIDYVEKLRNIPQLHVSGSKDDIIPPSIANEFVKKSASRCVHQKIIPDATHKKTWTKVWRGILDIPLKCY